MKVWATVLEIEDTNENPEEPGQFGHAIRIGLFWDSNKCPTTIFWNSVSPITLQEIAAKLRGQEGDALCAVAL